MISKINDWQNGQVVMQSQNQRPFRKPPQPPEANGGDGAISAREIRSSEAEKQEGHAQLKNPPSHLLSYDPKTIITKQGMKEQHGIRALHREKHGGEE